MAKLRGELKGSQGKKWVTRLGHRYIEAKVYTWHESIEVILTPEPDSLFKVVMRNKVSGETLVVDGSLATMRFKIANGYGRGDGFMIIPLEHADVLEGK